MSKLLDRIRAHAQPEATRRIEVAEWGDERGPLVITFSMVTMQDMAVAQAANPNAPLRQGVDLLCMKARGEDGKPLFSRADGIELMQMADPVVLNRVIGELGQRLTAEEIEKN